MKKQPFTIKVFTRETSPPLTIDREVQGYIVGCLGIHGKTGFWVVSHIPTGMSVMGNRRPFPKRAQAVAYATKLQDRFTDLHRKGQHSDWSPVGFVAKQIYQELTA